MTHSDPAHATPCPLCAPSPDGLLYESPRLRLIRVDDAHLPGYVRVVWRDHVTEMTDLAADQRAEIMSLVYHVETLQRRILQPDKVNMASLGNQDPHLHWHVIPRWRDDPYFPNAIWAPATQDPERATRWAEKRAAFAGALQTFYDQLTQSLANPPAAMAP